MDTGTLADQRLTVFVAGDGAGAKRSLLELARQIGFDAVDAGPLKNARRLEPLACLCIQLGYVLGIGTQIGLKLMHGSTRGRGDIMTEPAVTAVRTSEPREAVVHGSAKGFAQQIAVGRHRLLADEPAAVGGTDTGPGPYDLLLAALGACTSMTVRSRRSDGNCSDIVRSPVRRSELIH